MHGSHLVTAVLRGVVERIPRDALGRFVRDELDGLDDAVDNLDTGQLLGTAYKSNLPLLSVPHAAQDSFNLFIE